METEFNPIFLFFNILRSPTYIYTKMAHNNVLVNNGAHYNEAGKLLLSKILQYFFYLYVCLDASVLPPGVQLPIIFSIGTLYTYRFVAEEQ